MELLVAKGWRSHLRFVSDLCLFTSTLPLDSSDEVSSAGTGSPSNVFR